ncbi:prolyl oligopeptidase family serine peptidase [Sandarakinorhabdus sp.]|jgi:prolyl oligopeptidase|uniref:prolyl oligopeptidase family serine peptidase n=1 Tax=Sandarakinorhabdus sp. TaxID=1916663 RepID=UPI0028AD1592|nr:prolyl oligopeptidase family serine peptidase [Sandarakinorhabdus sp.]
MMMSTAASVVAAPIAYPETQRGFEVEARHGLSVPDPYRWLEADVRTDANVAKWVEAQNTVTTGYLAGLPKRDMIRDRLTALYNYERFGIPRVRGGLQFFARNSGLQNQSVLYVQAQGAEPRVLIDPNPWAKDGATALAEWTPSKDGKHLAYAVQDGGTDWRTIKVMNVATGTDLADTLEGVKYTGEVAWRPDGSGFYYSRFPAPPAGEKYQSATLNEAIWFHKLGTPQSADTKVFATPDRPKLGHHARLSEDGRWMVVGSSESSGGNAVFIADLSKGETPRPFVTALDKEWGFAGSQGGTLYFVTNKDAPRYQLLAVDGATGSGKPVVAEGAATLTGGAVIGKRLVVETLEDAKSVVRLYETDGKPVGVVPLPGIGTAMGFEASDDGKSFFAFSSFATPGSIWSYDAITNTAEVVRQAKVAFNPADYTVSQVFYPSKDGTKVPMFVAHRKDVDVSKPHPTLLYAYGGFNISSTPGFSVSRLVWMEMGGVFAMANIRGGGEYGAAWHDGGRLLNKQNVFDDFIAAGEALVKQGTTTPQQLAIQGGSNGGLLVGAVTNQRPDLFAAALPAVGVMDMLRYANWTAGRYWVDDYGDMTKPEMFRYNLGFSPYHNVKGGKDYPAILVTTADTDDRVVPGHSFKYAAALQAAPIGDKPHLIRIETRAGHGSGKPTDKIIAEAADLWAFAGYWTGLTK